MKRHRSNLKKEQVMKYELLIRREARSEVTLAAGGEVTTHEIRPRLGTARFGSSSNQMQVLPKDSRKKERAVCSLTETLTRLWCSKVLPGIIHVQKARLQKANQHRE